MLRLGGHGLPIGAEDPFAFARAHRAFGYSAAYVPEVALTDGDRLVAIEGAFAAENVQLAEIGIWRNLIAPEPDVRKANLDFAIERLAIADAVGAGCAVSFIGTFEPGQRHGPHPDNFGPRGFDACVETARYIIDAVRPTRAKFALEMMQTSLPDSAESCLELIRAVDRPMFAAHLDPVNLVMTPRSYADTGRLIRRCFEVLGPYIVSCHAKDIVLRREAALHLDEVQIGDGVLDYGIYLAELARLGGDVPLMLEHLEAPEYAVARDRIFSVGDRVGIAFMHRPA